MLGNNYLLWENNEFIIKTPFSPHVPYSEGLHIVIVPKADIRTAWQDSDVSAEVFRLGAKICAIMEREEFAPWFNLQANGNFGVLPGETPFFHLHVYGRNKTERWGKPILLPEAKGAYSNDPMPEADRERLVELFAREL